VFVVFIAHRSAGNCNNDNLLAYRPTVKYQAIIFTAAFITPKNEDKV